MNKGFDVERGIQGEVNNQLQNVSNFLNECSSSIKSCKIVEDLGFDNGYISSFPTVKSSVESAIQSISGLVGSYETTVIDEIDLTGKDILASLNDEIPTAKTQDDDIINPDVYLNSDKNYDVIGDSTADEKGQNNNKTSSNSGKKSNTNTGKSNNNSSGSYSNDTTSSNDNNNDNNNNTLADTNVDNTVSTTSTADTNVNNTSSTTNTTASNNTVNTSATNNSSTSNSSSGSSTSSYVIIQEGQNYAFSLNKADAISAGDIFADDEYSLTAFTNYLLSKYNIKNKDAAKLIYKKILEYGKEYNNTYHKNPVRVLSERELLSMLSSKMSNDLSKYPSNVWGDLKFSS